LVLAKGREIAVKRAAWGVGMRLALGVGKTALVLIASSTTAILGGTHMPKVEAAPHKTGDFLVDYEEKVFEDVKASPGEKALVTFHTVAFEGSIGLVNLLQAIRLQRKGFETSVLLYGPGVTLGVQRGFPKLGDEAFPGAQNFNGQIKKFMSEGGKVFACRFALQALYGHGEGALIEGIRPINPLDVLDLMLIHRKAGAFVMNTWTL
jgi:uncharacterized repeat protein (TIGR04044 family)